MELPNITLAITFCQLCVLRTNALLFPLVQFKLQECVNTDDKNLQLG